MLGRRDLMDEKFVIVVSGLPRSGTSMMMQMLEAGGMEVLTDRARKSDDDNPRGYFEMEAVKRLSKDQSCLENAEGKSVKVISELLKYLPQKHKYRVIFMLRNMDEIIASQNMMLMRRGKPGDNVSNQKLSQLFQRHLEQVMAWMEKQPNMEILCVNYNEILKDPKEGVGKICTFLGTTLNPERMAGAIDEALHRQRRQLAIHP
jgi:hypothetical protein